MILKTNTLYIVSTPIGNLDDLTLRAEKVLKNSDIILCEDTRHSVKLLNHFKIKKKLISYHKFNERKQLINIIEHINQGKILSLISDAGTPMLSDPGRILLNECIKRNIGIVPIPGVSSITTALSVSGFSDQFLFLGFLPKKESEINKILTSLKNISYSLVFFVPGKKINNYLSKFKEYFPERKILIAKELTKIHENLIRGDINNLKINKTSMKGEVTVVISDHKFTEKTDKNEIIHKAKKYLKKYSLKDTVELILQTGKFKKKEIYEICLSLKNEKNN